MLNEEQREIRRTRISGTDASAIAGLNPYRTKLDVYLEKAGLSEPFTGNRYTRWGSTLEPVIRHHFMTKHEEYDFVSTFETTLVHPEHDFVCGTPDGILWKEKDGKPVRIAGLEIKTADHRTRKDWGDPGTDSIPDHYLMQCHWYMLLTGLPHWHVAVLFGGNTYEEYIVEKNDGIMNHLFSLALEFVNEHMKANVPPDPESGREAILYSEALYKRSDHSEGLIEADAEANLWGDLLREARKEKSEVCSRVAELEAHIKNKIGTNIGVTGDFGTITWKKTKDKEVVDWKGVVDALGGASDEIIKQHTSTKPGHRRMNSNWRKDDE